ncbi:MAG: hypothetical protein ABI702_24605, partial [Burkholderiales bacterium]
KTALQLAQWSLGEISGLEPDTTFSFYAHHVLDRIDQVARLRSSPDGLVTVPVNDSESATH